MKADKLEEFFDSSQDDFDVELPEYGHEHRFLKKLESSSFHKNEKSKRTFISHLLPLQRL